MAKYIVRMGFEITIEAKSEDDAIQQAVDRTGLGINGFDWDEREPDCEKVE